MRIFLFAFILLFSAGSFNGCSKDADLANGTAHIDLYLTDAPADYDAVLIDIQSLEIISDGESGTYPLITPGIHNLLNLTNGIDTLLISADFPAGTISQFRFILGPDNSIVVDGIEYPLETPSAQTSGLKINVHETLEAGVHYAYWFDFDAEKSIVQEGNGTYKLKPVITMYSHPL